MGVQMNPLGTVLLLCNTRYAIKVSVALNLAHLMQSMYSNSAITTCIFILK